MSFTNEYYKKKYYKYKAKFLEKYNQNTSINQLGGNKINDWKNKLSNTNDWNEPYIIYDGNNGFSIGNGHRFDMKNENRFDKMNDEKFIEHYNRDEFTKNIDQHMNQYAGTKKIFPIEDEIYFWGRQMKEHALFLHLGLEDVDLKNEAFQIQNEWDAFMTINFKSTIDKTNKLTNNLEKIKREVNKLIEKTSELNKRVILTLKTGKWIGWIFISLAEHMQKETDYFARKISDRIFSREEEIKFINTHHSEETGTIAQLIDPSEKDVIEIVKLYTDRGEILSNMSEHENLLLLSIKYSSELEKFVAETGPKLKYGKIKSIISPILAEHAHREFERFTKTLRRLETRI